MSEHLARFWLGIFNSPRSNIYYICNTQHYTHRNYYCQQTHRPNKKKLRCRGVMRTIVLSDVLDGERCHCLQGRLREIPTSHNLQSTTMVDCNIKSTSVEIFYAIIAPRDDIIYTLATFDLLQVSFANGTNITMQFCATPP